MHKKDENCYYQSYGICTCKGTTYDNQKCVGKEDCENYISEMEYFEASMNGIDLSKKIKQTINEEKTNKKYDLSIGKSKKALKKEAKIEAEKKHEGEGYSLKDDPRFKDLFKMK